MLIEPKLRKFSSIWKMWIELNCRKLPTILKEWKFVCGLDQIVGIFLQFERCGLNLWLKQIVGRLYDLKRVNFYVNWIKFRQFEKSDSLYVDWTNCRKIPTIWKLWIELNSRNIPTIWKVWMFYVDWIKL